MKHFKYITALPLIMALLPVSGWTSAKDNSIKVKPGKAPKETYSPSDLAKYYAEQSGGLIQPTQLFQSLGVANTTEKPTLFSHDKKWANRLMPKDENWREFGQDWFTLDVDAFTKKMNAPDFLSAKAKYYRGLKFDKKYYQYVKPYAFMSSWYSNFHPPIKELTLPREQYVKEFTPIDLKAAKSQFFNPQFQLELDNETGTQMTSGNELRLLPNGTSFKEKMRFIRTAKKTLWFQVMAMLCDESSKGMVQELIEAKKRGVDVRIVTENMYKYLLGIFKLGCIKDLQAAGIEVMLVNDLLTLKTFGSAMHNKFWIKDGEEAILGGQNVVEVDNLSTGFNGFNRDTDVMITKGPAITDLVNEYIRVWTDYRKAKVNAKNSLSAIPAYIIADVQKRIEMEIAEGNRGKLNYESWLSNPDTRMKGNCRVNVQNLDARYMATMPILAKYAQASVEHVAFSSPDIYLSSEKTRDQAENLFLEMIKQKARTQGLKVDMISNGWEGGFGEITYELDQAITNLEKHEVRNFLQLFLIDKISFGFAIQRSTENRAVLREFDIIPNIRTYVYMNYIHSKQFMFDRLATYIGSFNIDNNSAALNHETGMICLDETMRDQIEEQFTLDLINSVPTVSRSEKPGFYE